MKNKRLGKTIIMLFAVLVICICSVSPSACAILSKNGTITLNVADSNTGVPLEDVTFRLYFFAAAYEKGNGVGYDYVIPYDDCNMDMDNLQDAYLPIHLALFANTHELPYTEKTSDKNGHIVFDNLVPGVYLVYASESTDKYFMPAPFVVSVPFYDNENKSWIYDVTPTPKMQIHGASETDELTYISVKKIWETDSAHPESISVALLKDFKTVETVELNESNNWSFRWDKLSTKHIWSVVEANVPDGYTVSYETSSNTVTIINKSDSPEGTTVSPSQPDYDNTTEPDGEPTTAPDELIYTGQLNWPIPVFSIAGLLLFSIGWAMLNFGKKDEEAA